MQRSLVVLHLVAMLCFALPTSAPAQVEGADYAFEQRPGAALPLETSLREADGSTVRLGDLLGGRPAVLVLGYYHCPNLCGVVRDDVFEALSQSGLRTPDDYSLISIGIDPAETPGDAASALADDRSRYPTPDADRGWHFLTGDATTVASIEHAVGFHSQYDVHLRQFIHPAGVVIVTPGGTVSGYVLGVGYTGGDIRTAVTLASSGGIAKAAVPILLLCFHYDALTGRYSLAVMKVLRLGAAVTVLAIGGTLLIAWRRGKRDKTKTV